ncbi:hypothetical protein HYN59_06935 [Flavobacterium album]|uniref:Thioredoxin domain-containing protein n=1 Tax=Flavobacterium album TaxID=2175091 RepID=A0A2S1QWW4_9FLAO|nr:T9SS type A sorting domain-containing protein [Flavobacterium album]AWH84874.1 hypothetical protein HYN59_06935 [Flavobacterium album]
MKKNLLLGLLLAAGLTASAQISGDGNPLADGSIAPDFTATDINGVQYSLYSQYLNAGKSVVIDFSATWCAPCWNYHKTHALADFYEAYGPNGSNEAMVFFIEGDIANTNTANLYGVQGPISPSQGNWTLGTPYPIIEDNVVMNLGAANHYDIDFFPTVYVICKETKTTTYADHLNAAQLKEVINSGCQTLVGTQNFGHIEQSAAAVRLCTVGDAVQVQGKLKNFGENNITTATVVLKDNTGAVVATQTYNGNFPQFNNAASINFNNVVLNPESTYTMEITSINGSTPAHPEAATAPVAFSVAGVAPNNNIEVRVHTDNYPHEITWQIKNSAGTLVASGGPYLEGPGEYGAGGADANTVKIHNVTLPGTSPECFTLVVKDAAGDGWSAGDGGIEIYSNGVAAYQNLNIGNFGSTLSTPKAFRAMGTLGTETITNETFAMYPNPTTGILNFTTQETVDVTVLDLTGKVVYTAKGIENGGSVNLGSLQSGMYIAKIKGLTSEKIEKIVIE